MKKLSYLIVMIALMFSLAYALQVGFELSPQVTSVFPKTETFEVDASISLNFGFQVKNYSKIKECTLVLDSLKNFTISIPKSDILMYETNIISYNIGLGNYTWKIVCSDIKNQTGVSEERVLEIRQKIVETESQTKFLIIMTLVTLILVTIIGILTSKSMKTYFEERRNQIAKERLRKKLEQLKEKSEEFSLD